MSVTINTQAMKTRETPNDQWQPVMIMTEADVNAVVQDTEPTGSETVWFDTSDQSEVTVPTMTEFENFFNVSLTTTGLTENNCVIQSGGGYARIGNLVIVNMRLSSKSAADYGISGLPTYTGQNRVPLLAVNYNTSGIQTCTMESDGHFTVQDRSGAGAFVSGCYIAG